MPTDGTTSSSPPRMNFPFRYGINSLLLNNKGKKFLGAEFMLGVEPRRDDVYAVVSTQLREAAARSSQPDAADVREPAGRGDSHGRRRGVVPGRCSISTTTATWTWSPAISTRRRRVLVSNLAQVRSIHWLQVKLIGAASNRDGLGALVKVETAHGTYTKQYDGKSGYLSQSSLPLVLRPGRRYRRHSRGSPLAIRTHPGDHAGHQGQRHPADPGVPDTRSTRYFTT